MTISSEKVLAFSLLQTLIIEAKKLDDGYSKWLKRAIGVAEKVTEYYDAEIIEDALQDLYDVIPSETENADWWPDELSIVMRNTKQLLDL